MKPLENRAATGVSVSGKYFVVHVHLNGREVYVGKMQNRETAERLHDFAVLYVQEPLVLYDFSVAKRAMRGDRVLMSHLRNSWNRLISKPAVQFCNFMR